MTHEEAIKLFEAIRTPGDSMYIWTLDLIHALDLAIGTMKAQEPKLVVSETRRTLQDDSYDEATYADEVFYSCPTCGQRFSRSYPDRNIKYCSACGQAVKWYG